MRVLGRNVPLLTAFRKVVIRCMVSAKRRGVRYVYLRMLLYTLRRSDIFGIIPGIGRDTLKICEYRNRKLNVFVKCMSALRLLLIWKLNCTFHRPAGFSKVPVCGAQEEEMHCT